MQIELQALGALVRMLLEEQSDLGLHCLPKPFVQGIVIYTVVHIGSDSIRYLWYIDMQRSLFFSTPLFKYEFLLRFVYHHNMYIGKFDAVKMKILVKIATKYSFII